MQNAPIKVGILHLFECIFRFLLYLGCRFGAVRKGCADNVESGRLRLVRVNGESGRIIDFHAADRSQDNDAAIKGADNAEIGGGG